MNHQLPARSKDATRGVHAWRRERGLQCLRLQGPSQARLDSTPYLRCPSSRGLCDGASRQHSHFGVWLRCQAHCAPRFEPNPGQIDRQTRPVEGAEGQNGNCCLGGRCLTLNLPDSLSDFGRRKLAECRQGDRTAWAGAGSVAEKATVLVALTWRMAVRNRRLRRFACRDRSLWEGEGLGGRASRPPPGGRRQTLHKPK